MAAHIELPFLYQTRTILRCHPTVTCATRRQRRLLSSRSHAETQTPGDHEPPESEDGHGGFLREKARQVAGSSKARAPTSVPNAVGTRIYSTITASERKAFETILRFTPKQAEPSGVKQQSPFIDAVDTDVENILHIFSSSIKNYHAERDEREARSQESKVGPSLASPTELPQKVARAPNVAAVDAIHQVEGTRISSTAATRPPPDAEESTTSEPAVSNAEAQPDHQPQPQLLASEQASSKVTTSEGPSRLDGHTHLGSAEGLQFETDTDTELSSVQFSEQLSRYDASTQQAVQARMAEIAEALHGAARSTTTRGDIAMWEVCEKQIFSMASHLTPAGRHAQDQAQVRAKRSKWNAAESPGSGSGSGSRFTFTKSHSDNAPELMEAAARASASASASGRHAATSGLGMGATDPMTMTVTARHNDDDEVTSSSSSTSTSAAAASMNMNMNMNMNLAVLHHVYPATLLLALRLYIQHFPTSPLAHNLLPRIRAFGHTSYVLGAGPQFYNSLLSLVWQTRSSLRQVDALLAEMERAGVDLTEETYRILRQIEDERAADLGREHGHAGLLKGSRGAAWWKRHDQVFWFPRILDWLAVVAKRLTMKDMVEGAPR